MGNLNFRSTEIRLEIWTLNFGGFWCRLKDASVVVFGRRVRSPYSKRNNEANLPILDLELEVWRALCGSALSNSDHWRALIRTKNDDFMWKLNFQNLFKDNVHIGRLPIFSKCNFQVETLKFEFNLKEVAKMHWKFQFEIAQWVHRVGLEENRLKG